MTERHEIEAWLGDDHGLTDDQIGSLVRTADEIAARYPEPDDADEREAALTVAYRVMVEDDPVAELGDALLRARIAEARALAGLAQAAASLIPGRETESGFADRAGVDRMTVRGWLGKRRRTSDPRPSV